MLRTFCLLGYALGQINQKIWIHSCIPSSMSSNNPISGVIAYDGHVKERFTLKPHLIRITGNSPSISKLLHLSGHIAKHLCRACNLTSTPYPVSQKKGSNDNVMAKGHTHQYYPVVPSRMEAMQGLGDLVGVLQSTEISHKGLTTNISKMASVVWRTLRGRQMQA